MDPSLPRSTKTCLGDDVFVLVVVSVVLVSVLVVVSADYRSCSKRLVRVGGVVFPVEMERWWLVFQQYRVVAVVVAAVAAAVVVVVLVEEVVKEQEKKKREEEEVGEVECAQRIETDFVVVVFFVVVVVVLDCYCFGYVYCCCCCWKKNPNYDYDDDDDDDYYDDDDDDAAAAVAVAWMDTTRAREVEVADHHRTTSLVPLQDETLILFRAPFYLLACSLACLFNREKRRRRRRRNKQEIGDLFSPSPTGQWQEVTHACLYPCSLCVCVCVCIECGNHYHNIAFAPRPRSSSTRHMTRIVVCAATNQVPF